MKISQKVREFARLQNQPTDGFIAADEAEAAMAAMEEDFGQIGRKLYMGAWDRKHD